MDTYILGIETSCDETSAAVVKNGKEVLPNIISSQADIHLLYGGVFPEVASRNHLENILPVIREALDAAGIKASDLTGIGVANEPGLIGALLVGLMAAKGLAYSLGIPLIPVHHLRGHIYANMLEHELGSFPILALIVSGGHTTLALWESHGVIRVLGETKDDAAGEALDKIARKMGLPYPGGPEIERLAAEGRPGNLEFPVARLGEGSLDFSYSGLKSAVINYLNQERQKGREPVLPDVAYAVQAAVIRSIAEKVRLAVRRHGVKEVVLGGGVTANRSLVQALEGVGTEEGFRVLHPSPLLCTDNGVMIAAAAHYLAEEGRIGGLETNARANAPLT